MSSKKANSEELDVSQIIDNKIRKEVEKEVDRQVGVSTSRESKVLREYIDVAIAKEVKKHLSAVLEELAVKLKGE